MKKRYALVWACALSFFVFGAGQRLHGQTKVLTYHNDNARTGQNLTESILTPANVNSRQFGKLHSVKVDGKVYAQPLIMTGVNIPGQGTHTVVYVATEHDSLYAIDASTGATLWRISFINPTAGITTVSSSGFCAELSPEIGITGTPVIDPSTGTIYVVAKTKENGTHVQRLHAIDIATHAEKFGGPVVIRASVAGTGAASQNGTLNFDPVIHLQRSGLLLQNGHVTISWGAHCDKPGFHGWVMSYNAATLSQEAAMAIDPDGLGGGVWMSGAGLAADTNSNIYFATGNGDYNGSSNFGDSILKFKGGVSFSLLDWFTPYNQATMNANDYDLGSGGVLLLPDLPLGFTHRQLLVQVGKLGTVYLIDRNRMGRYCSTCTNTDAQIVQELYHVVRAMWGMPAYWNGNVYFGGSYNGTLEAFAFNANNSGLLSSSPISQSVQSFNYPGITPSISAQGSSRGIVWGLENATFASSCCQVLHAYDATNLAVELYSSKQAPNSRDVPGGPLSLLCLQSRMGKYMSDHRQASAFTVPWRPRRPSVRSRARITRRNL
ncbi:MAG: pyrrolo-quinoline quinone [Bryobacteraceae bacterium]